MRGQQIPTTVPADLLQRFERDRTAVAVQLIRRLIHAAAFRSSALWISLQHPGSKQIVATVYRA